MGNAIRNVLPLLSLVIPTLTAAGCAYTYKLTSTPMPQLEQRAATDSLDAEAHYQLALGRWSARQYDEAEAELKEAIELDPKSAPAYFALSYLPFARRPALWYDIPKDKVPGDWKDAVEQADSYRRHALMLDPLVRSGIVRALEPKKLEHRLDPDVYKRIFGGFDDYNVGRYEDAFDKLSHLMDMLSSPTRRENRIEWDSLPDILFWYQGLAAAQTARYGIALLNINRLLQRRLQVEKNDELMIYAPLHTAELRYLLGIIQQRQGLDDVAEQSFKTALTEDLGLYMANVRLADLYERNGRLQEAVMERRRATATNPEDPSLLVDMGRTLMAADSAGVAVEVLRRAVKMRPRMVIGYYELGRALAANSQGAEAREALQHFIRSAPSTMALDLRAARELLADLTSDP
jgi:tetratricopeptide (TPR) repeat protein